MQKFRSIFILKKVPRFQHFFEDKKLSIRCMALLFTSSEPRTQVLEQFDTFRTHSPSEFNLLLHDHQSWNRFDAALHFSLCFMQVPSFPNETLTFDILNNLFNIFESLTTNPIFFFPYLPTTKIFFLGDSSNAPSVYLSPFSNSSEYYLFCLQLC